METQRILAVKWGMWGLVPTSYYDLKLDREQWEILESVFTDMNGVSYHFIESLPTGEHYGDINHDLVSGYFGLDINYKNPQ